MYIHVVLIPELLSICNTFEHIKHLHCGKFCPFLLQSIESVIFVLAAQNCCVMPDKNCLDYCFENICEIRVGETFRIL